MTQCQWRASQWAVLILHIEIWYNTFYSSQISKLVLREISSPVTHTRVVFTHRNKRNVLLAIVTVTTCVEISFSYRKLANSGDIS